MNPARFGTFISYHPTKVNPNDRKRIPSMKDWTPCEVQSLSELAKIILRNNWAPGVFRDGYKDRAHFLHADFIGLDFDSGEFTLDDAHAAFEGQSHIIGTTASHTDEHHKFRVVLTLERRITDGAEYKATVKQLSQQFKGDLAVADCARFFLSCKEIIRVASGERQKIIKFGPPKPLVRSQVLHANGSIPSDIENMLRYGVVQDRNIACYNIALRLGSLGKDQLTVFDLIWNSAIPTSTSKEPLPEHEVRKAVRNGHTIGWQNRRTL